MALTLQEQLWILKTMSQEILSNVTPGLILGVIDKILYPSWRNGTCGPPGGFNTSNHHTMAAVSGYSDGMVTVSCTTLSNPAGQTLPAVRV